MRNFLLTMYYLGGLAWCTSECMQLGSDGVMLPLGVFVLGFVVFFSIIGCLPYSDSATELSSALFATVVAVCLLIVAFYRIGEGIGGTANIAVGLLYLVLGWFGWLRSKSNNSGVESVHP